MKGLGGEGPSPMGMGVMRPGKGWEWRVPRPLQRLSSREEKAELLLDSQGEVQGLEAEIRRLRQEVRSDASRHCHNLYSSPHTARGPLPLSTPLLPVPNLCGLRLAVPISAPPDSGPGAVGTGQAGRVVPRGGRDATGAGRPPAPPAGGAATLPREAAGG